MLQMATTYFENFLLVVMVTVEIFTQLFGLLAASKKKSFEVRLDEFHSY